MKHPHDTLIRAWLDGRAVQYMVSGLWVDLEPPDRVEKMPHFYTSEQYRLRPVTVRYRLWLDRAGTPRLAHSLEAATRAEQSNDFLRWFTEWDEREV